MVNVEAIPHFIETRTIDDLILYIDLVEQDELFLESYKAAVVKQIRSLIRKKRWKMFLEKTKRFVRRLLKRRAE